MFSYRHGFHAGNHADVLKHWVLGECLRYLCEKPVALSVIDTHAGAGLYRLDSGFAQKSGEFLDGIARLWAHKDKLPPHLAHYVAEIMRFNANKTLHYYPGSPVLSCAMLRPGDRFHGFELHPSDVPELLNAMRAGRELLQTKEGPRVKVNAADGFAQLKALLPPPSRRGLILIDPPYEDKADYAKVEHTLHDALTRFATGCYVIWYPVLGRAESRTLPNRLKRLPIKNWLHTVLRVRSVGQDGQGMTASGLFVINPPWTLAKTLKQELPVLTQYLAQDDGADYVIETEGI